MVCLCSPSHRLVPGLGSQGVSPYGGPAGPDLQALGEWWGRIQKSTPGSLSSQAQERGPVGTERGRPQETALTFVPWKVPLLLSEARRGWCC